MMAIKNRIQGLGYDMVSVCGCSHPELLMKQLNQEFIPYPHHIVYHFKAVLVKKNLSVTSDLTLLAPRVLVLKPSIKGGGRNGPPPTISSMTNATNMKP